MAENKNLDLLDLEDENGVLPELPEANPFECQRPRRPLLLFALGVLVIVLATYIIVSVIRNQNEDDVDISLDIPVAEQTTSANAPDYVMPANKTDTDAADAAATHDADQGAPSRTVGDRKIVEFNPNAAPKVEMPKPRPVSKPGPRRHKPVAKPAAPHAAASGGWHVQFASLSTRSAAETSAARMKREHPSLLSGYQFVILAAELPNGATTYRVRIGGFGNSSEANNFCRNAQSDGLECYVTKQ
jgi:cell division septation protein DedD